MKRKIWYVLVVITFGTAGYVSAMNTHIYSGTTNAGVVFGPPGHNIGVEIKGHPGIIINTWS